MDARRKVLGSTEKEPEPGRNLVLTIDANIQYMAEQALDHAMQFLRIARRAKIDHQFVLGLGIRE